MLKEKKEQIEKSEERKHQLRCGAVILLTAGLIVYGAKQIYDTIYGEFDSFNVSFVMYVAVVCACLIIYFVCSYSVYKTEAAITERWSAIKEDEILQALKKCNKVELDLDYWEAVENDDVFYDLIGNTLFWRKYEHIYVCVTKENNFYIWAENQKEKVWEHTCRKSNSAFLGKYFEPV